MTKTCKICQEVKPVEDFCKHSMYKDKLDSRCKACKSANDVLRNKLRKTAPPMTETCECCGQTSHKTLVLDHCHKTQAFRGWLCERCNTGIGKLGDDLEGVWAATEYLYKFEDKV